MIKCARPYCRNSKGAVEGIRNDRLESRISERGFAVEDFMKPDRIIVGVDDAQSGEQCGSCMRRSTETAIA